MIDPHLTERLVNYWEKIRQQDAVPSIDKFHPQTVEDLWQRCFIVSITRKATKPVYTYDFIGEEVESILGKELVGHKLHAHIKFSPTNKIIEQMNKSIHDPIPVIIEGKFIDFSNNVVKYRSCLLPFGSSKQLISHFIIGISWINL